MYSITFPVYWKHVVYKLLYLMYNIYIILKTFYLHISKLGFFYYVPSSANGFHSTGSSTEPCGLILAAHDPYGMFGQSLLLLMCAICARCREIRHFLSSLGECLSHQKSPKGEEKKPICTDSAFCRPRFHDLSFVCFVLEETRWSV